MNNQSLFLAKRLKYGHIPSRISVQVQWVHLGMDGSMLKVV
jgi:hypothetical protein